jgi:Protein of unknown function (DUF4235)
MAESSESGTDKLITVAATLIAGAIAQRVVMFGWKAVRGTDPIKEDDSPLGEILIFAAVSAATVAAAKTWAAQKARNRANSA